MSRFWKGLVMISLLLNGVCLLYVYALLHPNPHGEQYYETEQIKQDILRIKDELGGIREARSARAEQGK